MDDTDQAWREWGKVDPYFGVLTDEKFRKGGARREFFASGEDLVASSLARLDEHFGPVHRGRALDFGCGVGRLCIPLARRFEHVVGVDISPGMLEEATANGKGLPIDFRLSDDTLSQVDGTFDLIFSFIVLQHMAVERGMEYLDRMLSMTNPGAGCVIEVPFSIHDKPVPVSRRARIAHRIRSFPGGNLLMDFYTRHKKPRVTPNLGGPEMQMNPYPVEDLVALLARHGFAEPLLDYKSFPGITELTITSRKSL